jgi:hypothetical protein
MLIAFLVTLIIVIGPRIATLPDAWVAIGALAVGTLEFGGLIAWLLWRKLGEVLVVSSEGVSLESRGRKVYTIPWSGGALRVRLDDPRIPIPSKEDPVLPIPGRLPPDSAWLRPGLGLGAWRKTNLTDEAYDAILRVAKEKELPIARSVQGLVYRFGVQYFLETTIG